MESTDFVALGNAVHLQLSKLRGRRNRLLGMAVILPCSIPLLMMFLIWRLH